MRKIIEKTDELLEYLREIRQQLVTWDMESVKKEREALLKKISAYIMFLTSEESRKLLSEYDIGIDEKVLVGNLENMLTAIEHGDNVLLLDAMEYEVIYMFEQYQEVFTASEMRKTE